MRSRPGDPNPDTTLLLLLDCDQFFVQCARLADPDGAGREPLLLVGGTPEGRGVVTSASYETRPSGARSGMPMARALQLCPRARVVPVPRTVCHEKSRAVRRVLDRFSPAVEAASIDEAYIDMTGTEALYGGVSLRETALAIQAAVRDETEIVVSIGGGTTRVVAKLAAGRAKPQGVLVVEPGAEEEFLRGFDLDDIPGVGPVLGAELRRIGLVTVEDAQRQDRETLVRMLGRRRGEWLHDRCRGIGPTRVEPDPEAKSRSREETFPEDIDDDDALEAELLALTVRLGADLRTTGLMARTITVKLRDADFTTRQASRTVPEPLETDRALYRVARTLLRKLRRRRRRPARLLGVAASQLVTERGGTQMTLFEEAAPLETERDRKLAKAVDDLRARFGRDSLRPGRLLERDRDD